MAPELSTSGSGNSSGWGLETRRLDMLDLKKSEGVVGAREVKSEEWGAVLGGILPEGTKFDFWADTFYDMHPVCRCVCTARQFCPKWCQIGVFAQILAPFSPTYTCVLSSTLGAAIRPSKGRVRFFGNSLPSQTLCVPSRVHICNLNYWCGTKVHQKD